MTHTVFFRLLLLTVTLAGCGDADAPAATGTPPAADLVVERGDWHSTFLLTGEIRARNAHPLNVPRSPGQQRVQIRWMAEDGATVRTGERVLELENSSFATDLEDKRLRAVEAENTLERTRAEARTAEADAVFEVERKRVDLEKARIEAAVPEGVLSGREYQDRQLALQKAELELAKAEADLAATRKGQAADVAIQRVELAKVRREIQDAETAEAALVVTAPTDGVLLTGDHPWEQRKLQVGDTVWMGLTVAEIPDLSELEVEAELSDVDEGRVLPGMRARVTADAYPKLPMEGVVEEISPVAREVEGGSLLRYFTVRVSLNETGADASSRLLPGMSVKVEVLGEPLRDVLLAPRAALDLLGDEPRVRAPGDHRARPVRLGPCGPHQCVVEDGVAEGDRLATAPVAPAAPTATRREEAG